MLPIFDSLRGLDFWSMLLRLLLAVACGAAIGIERSVRNRPAGFRTHILVCLGSAVAALVGNYLYLGLHLRADVTRISGQVITGLGFIGAGTIIVTRSSDIKGLTTAAGLWTSGIIGIALGSGYYEGGLLATVLVLITETTLARLGRRIHPHPKFSVRLLYSSRLAMDEVMRACKSNHISVRRVHIQSSAAENADAAFTAVLEVQGSRKAGEVVELLGGIPGIRRAELETPGDAD